MSISVELTMKCNHNGCTETIVREGDNVTRRSMKLEARKLGWQKKSADVHYCPSHSTANNGEKASKKGTKKATGKSANKKGSTSTKKRTTPSKLVKTKGPPVFEFGKGAEGAE